MKDHITEALERELRNLKGRNSQQEFDAIAKLVKQAIESKGDDEAAICLDWLAYKSISYGDAAYVLALEEKYRRFPDATSAMSIANALSSSSKISEAVEWAKLALRLAREADQAVRYILAEQVRLFVHANRRGEANSAFAEMIELGRRAPGDDDIDLPAELMEDRYADVLSPELMNAYASLLRP